MSTVLFSLEGALFAEFERAYDASRAMEELQQRGYARIESYSPFGLSVEEARRGGRWLSMAIVAFAVGLLGGVAGYLIQWFANARSYPLNIGGRPTHAAPAFVYPTIESVILLAAVTVFVGLLIALRLPRLWRPELEIDGFERVSDDRFWIAVALGSGGGDVERTMRELEALGARRIIHAGSES